MLSLKCLLFAALTASATVIQRDAASVQSSLNTIDSDLKSLTTSVNNYNGGLLAAIPIENAESNLEDDIDSATSTAQASNQLSSADSQAIIGYINNTLEPDIKTTLTALVNKKSSFQSAGLANTVKNDLATLKSKTDDLGNALVAKASSDQKPAGQAALDKIDADFQNAQAAYN